MIRFHCHRCGTLIQSADTAVGRDAMCPGCSLMLVIPAVSTAFPPPPPPPPVAADEGALEMPDDLDAMPRPPAPIPAPANVARTTLGAVPPPADQVSLPPGELPIPPEPAAGPPAMVSLAPGTLPVPLGGMPVPRPGASLPLSGLAPPPPGATAFEGLLGEACEGTDGPLHRLPSSALLSKAALRRLSFTAIAMGIIGAALSWVPFAGLLVAVFGLAVGTVATMLSSSRRDAPVRLALAGTLVGLVGSACGAFGTYWSLNKGIGAEIAQTEPNRHAANRATAPDGPVGNGPSGKPLSPEIAATRFAQGAFQLVQARLAKETVPSDRRSSARNVGPRLVFGGNNNGNGLVVSAKPEGAEEEGAADKRASGAAGESPIQWAAAEKGESQGSGPLQVTVTKVVVGKVTTYPIGDLQTLFNVTDGSYMVVWFTIKNVDASGSAEFKGWMSPQAEKEKIESLLVDDRGREHKPIRPFNKDEAIQKTTSPGPIFAGQSATDALVFRLLPDDVDSMDLTLSGKAIGRVEDLHFRIPRTMITRDNSNPLLGGAGN
jgi:hypothetical protein